MTDRLEEVIPPWRRRHAYSWGLQTLVSISDGHARPRARASCHLRIPHKGCFLASLPEVKTRNKLSPARGSASIPWLLFQEEAGFLCPVARQDGSRSLLRTVRPVGLHDQSCSCQGSECFFFLLRMFFLFCVFFLFFCSACFLFSSIKPL